MTKKTIEIQIKMQKWIIQITVRAILTEMVVVDRICHKIIKILIAPAIVAVVATIITLLKIQIQIQIILQWPRRNRYKVH